MVTGSETDVNVKGESALMKLLGLRVEEMGPERVVAFFEAGVDLHQPWRLVRRGAFTAVIETVATTGAYKAVKDRSQFAVGLSNVTDCLVAPPAGPAPHRHRAASAGEVPAALAGDRRAR